MRSLVLLCVLVSVLTMGGCADRSVEFKPKGEMVVGVDFGK